MHELIVIAGALGMVIASVAIFVTASLGLIVWLAGTDWARRDSAGAKRLARGT